MSYQIDRLEEILDENGMTKEVFISVKLAVNEKPWIQGYWLDKTELLQYLEDANSISSVIDKVAEIGAIALINHENDVAAEEY